MGTTLCVQNPLAVVFALCAACMFGTGNALEHRVVNEVDRDPRLHVGLLTRLARSPLWLLGMFGDVAAFGFQAAALAYGNLLFVQPLLVCGLLVGLPLSAHWSRQPMRRPEYATAAVLCASLSTFLVVANPSGGDTNAPLGSWLRISGVVVLFAVGAVFAAAKMREHVRAALLGFAAGALFGLTAALTRTFVTQIQRGVPYTAEHWEVYGLAVLSLVGILFTQHGFQSAPLSASLPALEATEPVVAATLGVVLFHEQFNGETPLDNFVIAVSIVAVLVCVIVLATSAGRRAAQPEPAVAPPGRI